MKDLYRSQTRTLITAILFLFVTAGCSDNPLVVKTDEVSILKQSEQMKVLNRLDVSIYYFVVEPSMLETILWAPVSREGNEIKAKSTKEFKYSEVFGYEEGDTIILHYWIGEDPDFEDVKKITIDTEDQ